MRPGTTLEDLEQAQLDSIVNRIANKGVYYGLPATDNEMFHLRVCDSAVDELCDVDIYERNHERSLCRDKPSEADKDDMRLYMREQIESLRDAGRLCYRRESEGFGYLTLTPLEWQKVLLEQLAKAEQYESSLDRIGGVKGAIERGNQRLLTANSSGKPIAMWFEKKPR